MSDREDAELVDQWLEIQRLRGLVLVAFCEGVNAGGGEVVAEEAWLHSQTKKALDADTR